MDLCVRHHLLVLMVLFPVSTALIMEPTDYKSLESWNFCNEVGQENAKMGSPRLADCADLDCSSSNFDNKLRVGDVFPNPSFIPYNDTDLYAVEKELYLGSLYEANDWGSPWQFWMLMLKNGNFDTKSALCRENGEKVSPIITYRKFPCIGEGCMNHPLIYHNWSTVDTLPGSLLEHLVGRFYGTYDIESDPRDGFGNNSYFLVTWEKNMSTGSWPWLMLYLCADASKGFNGGYHYEGRGIMRMVPESPNFKVRFTLNIEHGGGSCWKNNGEPCDGDVLTDVTRYSEMIINPDTTSWCRRDNIASCPPYHLTSTGKKIYRNNTHMFPYSAYHLYRAPGNANNPQAQELVQILPHSEWAVHGYPVKKGDGWVGDPRTWELDVEGLSSRLYFYQDPGMETARRLWTSLNVGTEIYVSRKSETAQWSVSDFDVLIPSNTELGSSRCYNYLSRLLSK
ncbi:hypothetical protein AMTRI_Chr06g175710 [Amborella trichopoda]